MHPIQEIESILTSTGVARLIDRFDPPFLQSELGKFELGKSDEKKMSGGVREIRKRLRLLASKKTVYSIRRFFKTEPGEYGEGEIGLTRRGISSPNDEGILC